MWYLRTSLAAIRTNSQHIAAEAVVEANAYSIRHEETLTNSVSQRLCWRHQLRLRLKSRILHVGRPWTRSQKGKLGGLQKNYVLEYQKTVEKANDAHRFSTQCCPRIRQYIFFIAQYFFWLVKWRCAMKSQEYNTYQCSLTLFVFRMRLNSRK